MGFVVKHGNPDFLLLLLQNLDLATIAKPGPVPAISEGEIREIRTVLPSLPEQTAIVRFLDHADRRIRRYIRRQAEADCAAGGAETGHHPPGRHRPD